MTAYFDDKVDLQRYAFSDDELDAKENLRGGSFPRCRVPRC